ncbi:hypothetical protein FHG87_015629 [Trinorchestia longiramus]|nr:hypothetical protein FHG87_015629 [Trinorchestia longiramus]
MVARNSCGSEGSVTLILCIATLGTLIHVNSEELTQISGFKRLPFSSPSLKNDVADLNKISEHEEIQVPMAEVQRVPNLLTLPVPATKTARLNPVEEKAHPLHASLKYGGRRRTRKKPSSKEIRESEPGRGRKKKKHNRGNHGWQDWSYPKTPPVYSQYDDIPGYVPQNPGIPLFVPHRPYYPYYPGVHGYYPTHHYHPPYIPAATPSRGTTHLPIVTSPATTKVMETDSTMSYPLPKLPMTSSTKNPADNPTDTNTTPSTVTELTSTSKDTTSPTTQSTSTTDPDAEYIPPYLYDRTGEIPSKINCTFSHRRI